MLDFLASIANAVDPPDAPPVPNEPDDGETVKFAFNAGSEARLAGEPLSANPYLRDEKKEYAYFKMGWKSVDLFFAVEAKWPYRKLTPVQRMK